MKDSFHCLNPLKKERRNERIERRREQGEKEEEKAKEGKERQTTGRQTLLAPPSALPRTCAVSCPALLGVDFPLSFTRALGAAPPSLRSSLWSLSARSTVAILDPFPFLITVPFLLLF